MQQISQGFPLQGTHAKKLILDLFAEQEIWSRQDLVSEVLRRHRANGGIAGKQSPAIVVKKTLSSLKEEGFVDNVAKGVWQRSQNFQSLNEAVGDKPIYDSSEPKLPPVTKAATPDDGRIVYGEGEEAVYLYYSPESKELADIKNEEVWPCKIGRTSRLPIDDRIWSQGVKTAFSAWPVIALEIRTDNSFQVEKAIHAALTLAELTVDESPGTEWFMTSPEKLLAWFKGYMELMVILGKSSGGEGP